MPTLSEVQAEIRVVCEEVAKLLTEKNQRYGNAAIDPLRVFSSASPTDQIKVRMDDKLSRIKHATESGSPDNEDAELDLLGYLVLQRVAKNLDTKARLEKP